jgi:DNA-directed RNA polymerase specialized sigma24 family protein
LIAWRRFEAIPEDPLPWLLGVARRVLSHQFRQDRRRGALTERLHSFGIASSTPPSLPSDLDSELAAGLLLLSAREREALLLVAWEGLEPDRAARVLGCSAVAFRVRLHRARRRIAAHLVATEVRGNPAYPRMTEELS